MIIDTRNLTDLTLTNENFNEIQGVVAHLLNMIDEAAADADEMMTADERTSLESQLAGIMEQLEVVLSKGDKLNLEIATLQDQLSQLRQTADDLSWEAEGIVDELGDEETRKRLDNLSAEYDCWSMEY